MFFDRLLPAAIVVFAASSFTYADNIAFAALGPRCFDSASGAGAVGAACSGADKGFGRATSATANWGALDTYSSGAGSQGASSQFAAGAYTSDGLFFDAGVASFLLVNVSLQGSALLPDGYEESDAAGGTPLWGKLEGDRGRFGSAMNCTLAIGGGAQTCSMTLTLLPTDTSASFELRLMMPAHGLSPRRTNADSSRFSFTNSARITGIGLLDANGIAISSPVTAMSGATYRSLSPVPLTVPEPSTLILLGIGCLTTAGCFRRRR